MTYFLPKGLLVCDTLPLACASLASARLNYPIDPLHLQAEQRRIRLKSPFMVDNPSTDLVLILSFPDIGS